MQSISRKQLRQKREDGVNHGARQHIEVLQGVPDEGATRVIGAFPLGGNSIGSLLHSELPIFDTTTAQT